MLKLKPFNEKKDEVREEVILAEKLKSMLENLYESTRYYNIVDHALTSYLLLIEKEVHDALPDNPKSFREALATLFVTNSSQRALRSIEILEKRYKSRLTNSLPYSVIALDILLDKDLLEAARRLYNLLCEVKIENVTMPSEDAYISSAIIERAARSLEMSPSSVRIVEMYNVALKILVDFVMKENQKKMDYLEYQPILRWIRTQLTEERYSESYNDIESFSAEIPPPLFFSPLRLYVVWKFLWKALELKVAPSNYVLDEKDRKFLIESLRKKEHKATLKLKFWNFLEGFYLTIISGTVSSFAYYVLQVVFRQVIPVLFLVPIIIPSAITLFIEVVEKVFKTYAEENVRKLKVAIPGFSSIENKRRKAELELRIVKNSLKRYAEVFG